MGHNPNKQRDITLDNEGTQLSEVHVDPLCHTVCVSTI